MTVYFIRKISEPTEIKIGSATNIPRRVTAIARIAGPVRLFASMVGGVEVERKIQMRFADQRIEGEWFRSNDDIETYIRLIADHEDTEFAFKPKSWTPKAADPIVRREGDARRAKDLLSQMYERYPRQTPVGDCLERAFAELHDVNVAWSRRRIRALHELQGLRVDLYEIVDLLNVLGIPRHEWADWISPVAEQKKDAA